ncbi:DUF4302 domain-containing protein [Chitinophaga qingshengii]|uniref:DUF4302 domain-containing protein n=1 Tax=Chitinophaga qingshengii TaxID=1569794 RepID=A0ABR7TMA8_9BACT|nr:DUF4302 domain-containing protein [Chitinophaga qingshengii]MBC9931125.1 DUF4302 domain-containing protein [Chitinophaga qingshengii]
MKKITLYTLLAMASMACNKSSDPFMEDPDKRLTQRLEENMQLLTSSQYGWKATIYPKGGKGFYYYFKFNKDNSVEMVSDFNSTTAVTPKVSTFRLKALQWPTLIFDTYNYIHLPNDPVPGNSGGTAGAGLQSDFQFAMDKMTGDTFYIKGIDRQNMMMMVKLTTAEQQDILAGKIADRMADNNTYVSTVAAPYIKFKDDKAIDAAISTASRRIRFTYIDDKNAANSKVRAFAFSPNGLILDSAFVYNGISIRELLWDAANKVYYVKSGNDTYNLQAGTMPVVPLNLLFGPGKDYTAIDYTPAVLKGTLQTDFNAVFTQCAAGIKAFNNTYTLNTIRIMQTDQTFTLRFAFSSPTTNYLANIVYNVTKNPDGSLKLIFASADGNAGALAAALTSARNYFETNTFNLSWVPNTIQGSTLVLGGLVKTTNNAQFFYGTVGN